MKNKFEQWCSNRKSRWICSVNQHRWCLKERQCSARNLPNKGFSARRIIVLNKALGNSQWLFLEASKLSKLVIHYSSQVRQLFSSRSNSSSHFSPCSQRNNKINIQLLKACLANQRNHSVSIHNSNRIYLVDKTLLSKLNPCHSSSNNKLNHKMSLLTQFWLSNSNEIKKNFSCFCKSFKISKTQSQRKIASEDLSTTK